jgi:N-acetylglucosamine-6-phosphate deacetylase
VLADHPHLALEGRIVTPAGVRAARLEIVGDRIAAVTEPATDPDDRAVTRLPDGALVVPGFVDLHVHGAAGYTFGEGDDAAAVVAGARAIIERHRQHGTTTMLASLVSAPLERLVDRLTRLAPLVRGGELAGLHLEGPFLSPRFRGAHSATALLTPSAERVERLLEAADGTLATITIAPELPGALDAITRLRKHNVVVAIGHTAATARQVHAALDAGASMFTHLFDAMPALHHRAGGPVLAAQTRADSVVELIADGIHLDLDIVGWQFAALGAGRIALVTDAMAATDHPDGSYRLGDLDVVVHDGQARLADGGALAGSTATMDRVFRRCVDAGVPPDQVACAAASTPARSLGWPDRGQLAPGQRADLVILDRTPRTLAVMHAGVWVR